MKNILITGCSRGIGFHIVKQFVKMDILNILCISRNKIGLQKLQSECLIINPKAKIHQLVLDLSETNSFDFIVNYIRDLKIGNLDLLINNAGFLVNKPFQDITLQELDDSININAKAPFLLIQRLIPFFNKNAHIVSISSMGGVQGSIKFTGLSSYSSTKSFIMTLTECLAEEFKDTDLKFNCLALGAVQTEMLENAFPGYKAPISADEISRYIYKFCIEGNRYFNGKIIPVSKTTP